MGFLKNKCVMASVLTTTMVFTAIPFMPVLAEDTEVVYTYDGSSVPCVGGELMKDAVIQGEKAEIYKDASKGNVLRLYGDASQEGVLKLPSGMYQNVEEGFTISMDVCVAEDAGNYTRLFQSSCCDVASRDWPWNFPGISLDLGESNLWRTEVFVGNNKDAAAEVESRNTSATAVSRGIWHTVSMSVNSSTATILVDGEELMSSRGEYGKLFGTEKYLDSFVTNYIGGSIYQDASIKAMIDNVKFYNSDTVWNDSTLQFFYDFEKVEEIEETGFTGDADTYTDGTDLTLVRTVLSPDSATELSILSDENGRYFYSVQQNGVDVIYASRLGIVTAEADFSTGAGFTDGSVTSCSDAYTLYQGKHRGTITDICNEYTFTLTKDGKNLAVIMRVYDDGIAYRYAMSEGAQIKSEASETVFPDQATVWTYAQPNVTYEGTYSAYSMKQIYNASATYTVPALAEVNGHYVLLTEAAVFSEDNSYCSSYLKTEKESKNLKWTFGNKQTSNVVMSEAFETPWRVAVIGEDLNTISTSDIVTSVNPDAEERDWSWVEPGRTAWSWWSSTGDDPIAYETQKDYIDFAAENGWEYVCLDYGWILWDDYKDKVKELADYAKEKGVGIWLWYGVNDVGHTSAGAYPDHSLLNEENIRNEFEWASSLGIKGVKVDYYESDNQDTMHQMYLCADIAADNHLMVLFHGCTNPGGEERTFPNIVSYEAVYGAEYYKWRSEPSISNIITYLFTRNAIGSADFTPTALPVANIDATYGFMLATAIYIESGIVHFAENVNVYEGYEGLGLMNKIPAAWDETIILEGKAGDYGSVARRTGDDWMIASLTEKQRTADLCLDFLEEGKTYHAYVYQTAPDGLAVKEESVMAGDILSVDLSENDGCSVYITESEFDTMTEYEKQYEYLEAEQGVLDGRAVISDNQYASGMKVAGYLGNGAGNTATYEVYAQEQGVYELKLFYVSGVDRRYEVIINDAKTIRTGLLNSGDWVTVNQESIFVELEAGKNIICVGNSTKDAPNLDRIAISKAVTDEDPTISDTTEDEDTVSEGEGYTYDIYEAENAIIAGDAVKNPTTVGWLGNGEQNYVLFDSVNVKSDGTYYLMLKYFSGEDRQVYISVNGEEPVIADCPSSGAWTDYAATVYLKVNLKAGNNTIKLYNPIAYCPDVDAIGISTTTVGSMQENQDGTDSGTNDGNPVSEENETAIGQENTEEKTPQTGDRAYILLFAVTALSSALIYCRKRKSL